MKRTATGLVALAIAGCGSTATVESTSIGSSPTTVARSRTAPRRQAATPGAWTGYGARLADWETAHPKNLTGCSAGTCFGPMVTHGGTTTDRFITLTTTGHPSYRVAGYEQAIGDGTSLAAAKSAVLALMPADTVATSFRVASGPSGPCAFWNLKSETLGRWFSGKAVGDPAGDIGILFDTAAPDGSSAYDPTNVNDAIVSLGGAPSDVSC